MLEYPKSLQPLPKHARKVFDGILFSVWQWEQEMFDGSTEIFEKIGRRSSVGIIPITQDNKIILTVQKQPGIDEFVGLVGGIVDSGEDVVDCANRELLEEAGCISSDLELWFSVQPVAKIEWPVYFFVARNCKTIAQQTLDIGEKIALQYVTWEEFLQTILLDNFRDTEISLKLLKAQNIPGELEKIRRAFFG